MIKGINGLQMGLFDDLIKSKCHSDHFPTFWKNIFCLKKSWSMKALNHVLDTSDDAKTYPEGPQTCLNKKSNFEMFVNIFIVCDRL